jgi:hypothetical protein
MEHSKEESGTELQNLISDKNYLCCFGHGPLDQINILKKYKHPKGRLQLGYMLQSLKKDNRYKQFVETEETSWDSFLESLQIQKEEAKRVY